MRKRTVFQHGACGALVALALAACGQSPPAVCIEKKDGARICVDVEVARTQSRRQLGLMFRRQLDPGAGMLFYFDGEGDHAFTMTNTYIPLDMIFISRDKRIVGWVENARPLSQGPYAVGRASQYVLEVNGLFCRRHEIAVGDTVSFERLP